MNLLTKNIFKFLKANKIPVAEEWLQKSIESHPDYPTLLCISQTLNAAGISCITHQINLKNIDNITLPALFHLQNDDVILIENKTLLTENIIGESTGVVININAINLTTQYKAEVKKQKNTAVTISTAFAISILLIILLLIQIAQWQNNVLVLSSILGLYICYQIFCKENGDAAIWVNTACNALGNGCDKVFYSTLSKGILGIKLFDAAFIYYFTILFYALFNENILLPYYTVLVAIPLIITSIIYQKLQVKAWCALCLIIAAIISSQVLLLWFTKSVFESALTLKNMLSFACCAFLSLVWFPFKSYYLFKKENLKLSITNQTILRDPKIFVSSLQIQKQIEYYPNNNDMVFGNSNAPLQVLIVCQPYCNPCAIAHKQIEELLKIYKENICLKIVWLANNENAMNAVNLIYDVVRTQPLQNSVHKIEEWFSLMNFEIYSKENANQIFKINNQYNLQEQKEWVADNGIDVTPTIFINNHQMPIHYSIDDFKIMIPNLIEIFDAKKDYADN